MCRSWPTARCRAEARLVAGSGQCGPSGAAAPTSPLPLPPEQATHSHPQLTAPVDVFSPNAWTRPIGDPRTSEHSRGTDATSGVSAATEICPLAATSRGADRSGRWRLPGGTALRGCPRPRSAARYRAPKSDIAYHDCRGSALRGCQRRLSTAQCRRGIRTSRRDLRVSRNSTSRMTQGGTTRVRPLAPTSSSTPPRELTNVVSSPSVAWIP